MWSIYKRSQLSVPNSEAKQLAEAFPRYACHDEVNVVFVAVLANAKDPFELPQTENTDQLALLAAQFLYADSERGMHLNRGQAEILFRHPAHKLWCAAYGLDQREEFKFDYSYVGRLLQELNPSINWPDFSEELEPQQARNLILDALSK
jgi:hypothetical protein